VWKDVSKHKRVAIFSVFAAAFLLSSAFGGLGTFTNVREHNGRVSITIGAPHEVRLRDLTHMYYSISSSAITRSQEHFLDSSPHTWAPHMGLFKIPQRPQH
jgi:hypothetical protein